jgi:hypothetical protein
MIYLLIFIGSWQNPDRIIFDSIQECEIAAERLKSVSDNIITACVSNV